MKKLVLTIPAVALGLMIAADQAWGQNFNQPQSQSQFVRPQGPQNNYIFRQPTVSPYIGLLRRGSSMGLNYFSLVRPEMQTQDIQRRQQAEQDRLAQQTNQLQQQQQQMLDPNTQVGANPMTGASRTMRATGHNTSLMNLQGRFMTR